LENAQRLAANSPETLLALGYYQYRVLRDYSLAKASFDRVSKLLPGNSEAPKALATVARRQGHWDESVAYWEEALALDPRNTQLLTDAGDTYAMLRQFPAALKLYDRVLDITPNDPEMMVAKAGIYQAQGKLQQAASFLSEINEQTPSSDAFLTKVAQLQLERNYGEAVRLLQTRLAQFHFGSEFEKNRVQVLLADAQRLAGDTAGAKVSAEQARDTLEQVFGDQPDNLTRLIRLSRIYALTGQKDLALKAAARAVMLCPRVKDSADGPRYEENLALIQTIVGENSRAILTLTQLLHTPYTEASVTPALLRLSPYWDPLRSDPRFQKLCEEK
jgi:tetratricopeptide (TPR) repeat protein